MIAIDGLPPRGIYGGAGLGGGGGGGSNGGPNITASSFAAAAAAAAAANNGNSSSSVTVPSVMMMPGAAAAVATSVHPPDQTQQPAAAAATWGEMVRSRREYTLLKKVVQLLQDNRLKTGDEEAAEKLRELNRSQNESFPLLKTVLNAIFITTGVVLLIAVVVVIMYTSIVKNTDEAHVTDSSQSWSSKPGSLGANDADDSFRSNHVRGGGGGSGGGGSLHPVLPPTQGIALNDGSTPRISDRSIDASHIKKCRMIPVVQEGDERVTLVQMCFRVPPSLSPAKAKPLVANRKLTAADIAAR